MTLLEFFTISVAVAMFVALFAYPLVLGIVRSSRNGDTGWMLTMIIGMFFGVGFVAAWIYLISHKNQWTGEQPA